MLGRAGIARGCPWLWQKGLISDREVGEALRGSHRALGSRGRLWPQAGPGN